MRRRAPEKTRQAKYGGRAEPAGLPRAEGRSSTYVLIAVGLAAVVGAVCVAHWGVLSAQAIGFDETLSVFQNPSFQNATWESAVKFFREMPSPYVRGYYEPLTLTSLLIDVMRGGWVGHLQPFHQTAVILHVANTLLIVWLLYSLFGNPWIAAALGLLFGTHPLTVEPVAWVWERKTLLATFFALWTFLLYVRYARRGSRAVYVACVLTLALSLLSKPTGTPIPVLLILLDWWPLNRLSRKALLEKIPFFVVTVVSAVITVYSTDRTGEVKAPPFSAVEALTRTGYLIAFYFGKIVWPARLTSLYRLPTPLSLTNTPMLIGCLVTLAIFVATAASLRRTRAAAASLAFFLIAIAPTLGLVQFTWVVASDKYVYLPAIGLLMGAAYGLNALWKRTSERVGLRIIAAGLPAAIGLIMILPARAAMRNWSSTERYNRSMLEVDPTNSVANYSLGLALIERKQRDEAAEHFRAALRYDPPFDLAHSALGLILYERGQFPEALKHFDQAVKLTPTHPFAHNGRAQTLTQLGRLDEAVTELHAAIKLRPAHPGIWCDLGDVLFAQRRYEEAAQAYRKVVAFNPRMPEGQHSLGRALLELGRAAEAVAPLRLAIEIAPNWAEGRYTLGLALAQTGDIAGAEAEFRKTLQLNPGHTDAARQLGALTSRPASRPG